MSQKRFKIGIVGCGRISNRHFDAIEFHSDKFELVGLCDVDLQALDDAASKWKVPGFNCLEDMLEQCELDMLCLCTPSGLHPQQAITGSNAGKIVVTEKPMATNWQAGIEMVSVSHQNHTPLFVVKQNRFNSPLQMLKNAVEQGRFGNIYHVNVNVYWTRPQSYYDLASWRGTWELDGGAFMNQASHYVDLLQWLIGPVDRVHAMTATLSRDIEAEDSGVVNICWQNGALGSMNVTMLTYPKNLEGSITVLGEHGTVRVGGIAVNEIKEWQFADQRPEDQDVFSNSYNTASVYGFGHRAYYDNLYGALIGNNTPETDGREGLRSLALITAIYESAKTQQLVSLPQIDDAF